MNHGIDWKLVKHARTGKFIGAIGFIGEKIATVATFYPDKDWNHDGQVDFKEKFLSTFGLTGKALTEVLTQAHGNPDLYMRDPNGLRQLHGRSVQQFATGMAIEGIYKTYFKMGVGQSCGALASQLVKGNFAKFFIRKGMERMVKEVYKKTTSQLY